jgi:lambda family phage portal protein
MAARKASREKQLELALKDARKQLAIEHLRAFESAKDSRRTEGWLARTGSADADIRPAWQRLVARHQDLVDSNPWANRAVKVISNNWIGDGIIGSPVGASQRYLIGWNDWAESVECDWEGKLNWYGLQSLAARTIAVRGSVLIRRRIDEDMAREGLVPLRLQVLEPDYLDTGKDNGSTIRFGKQYSISGKLEGYWLRKLHPGETHWTGTRIESEFVPKADVIHAYEVLRPGQSMGVPWGAPVLLALRDVDDILTAQMLKAKIASCFTAFVYSNEPDAIGGVETVLTETLEPGAIEILPDGKDIKFSQPPQSPDFVSHNRFYLHAIAAGYGITFEALTGIYSEVNFSSGRMGWIEFHRNVAAWRWNLAIPQIMDPVHRWFNAIALQAMSLRGPRKVLWTPPRRELVDPTKEIAGLVSAVQAGFMSLSEVQRSLGYIPEEVMAEAAEDKANAEALGLNLSVFTPVKAVEIPESQADGEPDEESIGDP